MTLVAGYNFEQISDPSGPTDVSGNGHLLTWGISSDSVVGYHGDWAIQSDPVNTQEILGAGAYGTYPDGTPGSSATTILFWAKAPTIPSWSPFFSVLNDSGRVDPMGIWVESDGSLNAGWYDASDVVNPSATSMATGVVALDTWVHVAAVFEPSIGVTLYADGAQVTTYSWQDGSSAFYGTWETLLIGGSRWGSAGAIIDDLRIYDEVLSQAAIVALMGEPVGGVNKLRIGAAAPIDLRLGTVQVEKVYLGSELVYG